MSDSFDELREFFVPGQLVEVGWESYSGAWQANLLLVLSADVVALDTYTVFHACLLRQSGDRTSVSYTVEAWLDQKKFWKRVIT
jgi:hypothetical protein